MRMKGVFTMKRTIICFFTAFAVLGCWHLYVPDASVAVAQTIMGRRVQPRIVISPARSTLAIGENSTVRIRLLDPNNNPSQAGTGMSVTLILTVYDTLENARRRLTESNVAPQQLATPLGNQRMMLPADREAVWARFVFPTGATEVTLRFNSRRMGRLRIFAEAPTFNPGSAIVTVAALGAENRSGLRSSDRPLLIPVVWQGTPTESISPEYYLALMPDGVTEQADLQSNTLVDRFYVSLNKSNGNPIRAVQPVEVFLSVQQNDAASAFTMHDVRIEQNEAQTRERVELQSRSVGRVLLQARAIENPGVTVHPCELPWTIKPLFQATALALHWDRQTALASGLDGIKITAYPLQAMADKSFRNLRPEEEGLPGRVVEFSIDQGFGFQFAGGNNRIEIPRDSNFGEIIVYGKRPYGSLNITARSYGFSGQQAEGATRISFYWPWLYLLLAAAGGLVARLFFKEKSVFSLMWGMTIGTILYCIVCLGAITLGKVSFGGWEVELARLPIESPVVPPILGFIFSFLISDKNISFLKDAKDSVARLMTGH